MCLPTRQEGINLRVIVEMILKPYTHTYFNCCTFRSLLGKFADNLEVSVVKQLNLMFDIVFGFEISCTLN